MCIARFLIGSLLTEPYRFTDRTDGLDFCCLWDIFNTVRDILAQGMIMVVKWRFPIGEKYLDFDWLDKKIPKAHPNESSHGWCCRHPNTTFRYNPTVPTGNALTGLAGVMQNLQNRWDYRVIKVDEWIEVSPSHPYYKTIITQKQDIIRRVKEGLTSVGRAISDVELLAHDARRYKQILSFIAEEDKHSLRAMFIDQVDAYLPEGVSMRSIAPRWPTIIADFQFLDKDDVEVKKVKKRVECSNAEAVILATKMKLYNKWKKFFGSEVKDRYRRIIEHLKAREASIEEYRNWIRPLIRRILQMREVDDKTLMMNINLPIGGGVPVSLRYVEYWAWSKGPGLEPTGPHKAPRIRYEASGTGPKAVAKERLKVWKDKTPRFMIEPYDEVVKKIFIPAIEKKHGVKITKEDVLKARIRLYEEGSPSVNWYVLVHFPVTILTFRLPTGLEVEDIDINELSVIFVTQNMMLVKILELIAEEKKLDAYIDELLGKKVVTEKEGIMGIEEVLKKDFPEIYGKEEKEAEGMRESISGFTSSFKKALRAFITELNNLFGLRLNLFKGPYDPFTRDRLFYGYGRPFLREEFQMKIWPYMLKTFGGV